ncbi:MAG: hypothetical protein ABSC50_09640 [Candidatus Bathyarchaeia archaeon]
MIYDIALWSVPVANREQHREIMRAIYSNIQSKHEQFASLKSSRLYVLKDESSGFETWSYVDAFADEYGYTQNVKALDEDVQAVTLRREWESLIVPGSFKTGIWREFAPEIWI